MRREPLAGRKATLETRCAAALLRTCRPSTDLTSCRSSTSVATSAGAQPAVSPGGFSVAWVSCAHERKLARVIISGGSRRAQRYGCDS
jgi:hypothetical protein